MSSESQPQLDRLQQRQRDRFRRMGLEVSVQPDGRSLVVTLPLRPAPFESLTGPQVFEQVVFSTVGPDHIKCLAPRPLFGLPLLDVRRCGEAAAIESVIREAWRSRTAELRDTARLLRDRGIEVGAAEGASVLAFALPGEPPASRVMTTRIDETVLPGAGRLSGIVLAGPEERVFDASEALDSGSELVCRLGSRLEELERIARERAHRARSSTPRASIRAASTGPSPSPPATRQPKVLLVGQLVIGNAALRDALARQGYAVATARSETEALARLAGMTPDLILSQYALGRSDGASLAQATRTLPGIAQLPVVLFDDNPHAGRREAARAVGAAGYVTALPDPGRFVARLEPLVVAPRSRRFKRYALRMATRLQDPGASCLAIELGRGGLFLATDVDLALHAGLRGELVLPNDDRRIAFEGEVLYRGDLQGTTRQGLGVRFCRMSEADEAALIASLAWLDARR